MSKQENFGDKANAAGFAQNPDNINKAGRPKKLYTIAGKQGYKPSEVRDVMAYCLTMTEEERKTHLGDDPDSLEAICIKSINKSLEGGEYKLAQQIIEMVAGRPNQKIEQDEDIKITVEYVHGEGV